MTPAVWTTKGGAVVPVREMTDDHLRNAIRFVRRRSREHLIASSLAVLAEMDDEDGSAEQAFMSFIEDPITHDIVSFPCGDPEEGMPVFLDLVRELRRRGLRELPIGS